VLEEESLYNYERSAAVNSHIMAARPKNLACCSFHSERYDGRMPERFDPYGYIQQAFAFEAELRTTEEAHKLHRLHESLAPYLDTQQLRQLVAEHRDLRAALQSDQPPAEVLALLDTLAALLRPSPTEQIRSPANVVGILMVQMAHLDQEELRTVLLDT
jgi:hypothetical protein